MDKCISAVHLARWIEGNLGDADQESVTQHLSSCDDCRRAVGLAVIVNDTPALALSPVEHAQALAIVLGPGTICADVNLWSRWVEETLSDAELTKVNQHLADCDDCRRTVALARIASEHPAPHMTDTARRRVENVVLPRKRIAWTWQVAAAAAVVFGVALYFMMRPPVMSDKVTKSGDNQAPSATFTPEKPEAPKPEPPKPEPPKPENPKPEPPRPEPPKPPPSETATPDVPKIEPKGPPTRVPHDAKLFSKVTLSEARGLSIQRAGQQKVESFDAGAVGYGDTLIAEKAGAITVDGAALVLLDASARVSVMLSATSASYVLLMHQGLALIDTIGSQQEWDVWFNDDAVSLSKMKGRVSLDASKGGLSVGLVAGTLVARRGLNSAVSISIGGQVTLTERGLEAGSINAEKMAERYQSLKPEIVTLFACDFGKDAAKILSGTVKEKEPGTLDAGGSGGPTAEMIWAGVKFPRGVVYDSGVMLAIRYRTSASALAIYSEGCTRPLGRHGGDNGWVDQELPLYGLSKDGAELLLGTNLSGIQIGVLKGEWLEIDKIKITRRIE